MKLSVLSFAGLIVAGGLIAAPDDLDDSFQALKDAEAKKDAAQVKKLAAETIELVRKEIKEAAPESAADREKWKKRVGYLEEIQAHAEYAVFSTALQAPPETTVDILAALEEMSPKSKYLDQAYGAYFQALTKTGAAAKIPAVAEKALTSLPANEDCLVFLAGNAFDKQQLDRALGFADRLVAAVGKRGKPEGLAAADWDRRRAQLLSTGYWIAGMVHAQRQQFYDANRDLRAALPFLGGADQRKAATLFQLGVANYQLGKIKLSKAQVLEAVKFSDQAAAIPGPLAQEAWHNAQVMRTEAGKMR
jgi:tetratricopeptide (TPR) repeat protein